MKKKTGIEIAAIAICMIIIGWQAIASDVISPYRGKSVGAISFPFEEPYVPFLGGLLIVGGIYVLYRILATLRRK
jgi:hypothetical protein